MCNNSKLEVLEFELPNWTLKKKWVKLFPNNRLEQDENQRRYAVQHLFPVTSDVLSMVVSRSDS